jgi:hypothetical protein
VPAIPVASNAAAATSPSTRNLFIFLMVSLRADIPDKGVTQTCTDLHMFPGVSSYLQL